jgi:hypothetical protein
MTADPDARPVSLRSHLRMLKAGLDEAARVQTDHLEVCGCRGTCAEARRLARLVLDSEYQLQMTRFLNEETDR